MNAPSLSVELDRDGFLQDHKQWTPQIAEAIAADEDLALSDAHWELIHLIRDFYQQFDRSPAMRPLVRYVKQELGPEKGNSMYLLKLFPDSPAKRLSRIAGLPRPENCL